MCLYSDECLQGHHGEEFSPTPLRDPAGELSERQQRLGQVLLKLKKMVAECATPRVCPAPLSPP